MYLTIAGDFDPEDVMTKVSMQPWEHYRKHSRSLQNRIPRVSRVSYGRVVVASECPDLYDMSDKLYQQLKPYKEEFISLSKNDDLHFCCSTCLWMIHDIQVSTPPIGFHSDVVSFLGAIGASIDVDSYEDEEYQLPTSLPFYNSNTH